MVRCPCLFQIRSRVTTIISEDFIEPILLVPARDRSDVSEVRGRIADAYVRSPQLGVMTALHYYCRMQGQGDRPKELHEEIEELITKNPELGYTLSLIHI